MSERTTKKPRRIPSWPGLWVGLLLLGAWLRWQEPWLLALLPLPVVLSVLRSRRPRPLPAVSAVALIAATLGGFAAHFQLHRIQTDWDAVWLAREERAATTLGEELDRLVESGEAVVATLSEVAATGAGEERLAALRSLRARHGMEAVALYGPEGALETWDGVHRGPVPEEVTSGTAPFIYGERPLFSYLYFTRPIPSTGGTAVAAALLRMSFPPGLGSDDEDFVSRVEDRTGEALTISRSERMIGESVWDFRWEGTTLFSASVDEPLQSEEREATLVRWGRTVLALLATAWLLLAVGSRRSRWGPRFAGGTLVAFAAILPPGRLLGLPELDSPTSFLLAPPFEATLLRTLLLGSAAVVVMGMAAGWWTNRNRPLPGALPGMIAVGVGFPLVIGLFRSAPSASFLVDSESAFVLVQAGAALTLSLVSLAGLLWSASGGGERPTPRPALVAAGLAGAGVLALLGGVWVAYRGTLPLLFAALWAFPAVALIRSHRFPGARLEAVSLWLVAGALGVTCALPFAWQTRLEARMELGETELARLDTTADPYTEFLLQRFATRVDSLEAAGAGTVELLYEAWVGSGLAREGLPAWLTLWSSGDLPLEDLRIGLPPPRPTAADEFLAEARVGDGPLFRRLRRPDARYVAVAPLRSGAAVTAVIPPRSAGPAFSALEPLFGGYASGDRDLLDLIPLVPGDVPAVPDSTVWMRTGSGWRGERTVDLPDGVYHAHYTVELPGAVLLTARGTLLLVLDLGLLGLLFGSGLLITSPQPLRLRGALRVFRTFQGRVTVTLFLFFLLSVVFFGALGYRTLSGAAQRTATALAERAVDEAAGWYLEVQGSMDLLARRVGADLLEYESGALAGGSVSEMVELGLYEGWLPYPVHERLSEREALTGQAIRSVGSWDYVVAYRRMPDGAVLGAPVALEAGAAALRRQEMIDLLGFSLLVGAGLSLGLAFLVGRTLVRPIRDLRDVTGRVGRGDLAAQLPEERLDEFGAVFEDFNRMVTRLRQARRDLVRTTRRTQAIVEEAATGVVALDAAGRVTLVNPRAEALLRVEVRVGDVLPGGSAPAKELASWVDSYLADGPRAADTEIHSEERRIRVQARRISGRERFAGLVLSLEDVTDELRTERILAWGEMAQQVAHEVKNPLTPIKLSVQHIRRAWEDQSPDFSQILRRNVDATLLEIERLAAIAQSFSRFAAPGPRGEAPVVPVDLAGVVAETLDLYATDEGRIRFESRMPADLPPVRGRADEVKEVLLNLLENARTAIEEEGLVLVEAQAVEDGVELRIVDDGPGIPEPLLPRIFEPHFSTRSSGTGLGLAIVRRLVDSWGGTVEVESRVGEGTTITVLLPRWEE